VTPVGAPDLARSDRIWPAADPSATAFGKALGRALRRGPAERSPALEIRTESPPPTTGAIQSVAAVHSVDKYRIRLLMSVLTEWYGRKRLPESKTDCRIASMSAWPIAFVKIGSMYSTPSFEGRISSSS